MLLNVFHATYTAIAYPTNSHKKTIPVLTNGLLVPRYIALAGSAAGARDVRLR